jgi:hypothetical protein
MTTSPQHYSPWERTEAEDAQIQSALESAEPDQLSGFISELVALAESRQGGTTEVSDTTKE